MMNPITLGLAVAATASLGFASTNGDDPTKKGAPAADSLFQDGVKVTYKPGSGITFASDSLDYSLNISGRIQAKWYYTALENGPDTNSFQARRVRTKFEGNVWSKDITYMVQLEHTASPNVLDGIVGWKFWSNDDAFMALNLGLQKFRGGLQSDNSSGSLEFNERSMATQTFADNRALGALLYGGFGRTEDEGSNFMWHLGAMNNETAKGTGAPAAAINESNELNYTVGILWAGEGTKGPTKWTEGDLAHNGKLEPVIGANFAIGNDQVNGVDNESSTINVYAAAKFGSGLAAQAEVFIRSDDPQVTGGGAEVDSMGWYAQASYTTAPGEGTQWAFGGRVSMVTLDDPIDPSVASINPSLASSSSALAGFGTGDVMEISGVISAYYHEHKLKSQIMFTYQTIESDTGGPVDGGGSYGGDTDNMGIDIMATLAF